MRKTLCALALMLALGCPALAREILCPPVPQPPPQAAQEGTMQREILTPPLAEIALTLLALF